LYINDERHCAGLFGYAIDGVINSLGLENVDVTGYDAGAIAGIAVDIQNCYSTGRVSGEKAAGGLAGALLGGILECYSTADITYYKGEDYLCGGLVAKAISGSMIEASFSTGNVTGDGSGGIVGSSEGSLGYCFSTGNVTGKHADGIGHCNYITACACVTQPEAGYSPRAEQIKTTSTLQVGINGNEDSQVSFSTKMNLNLSVGNIKSSSAYNSISNFMNKLNAKAVELGAAQNRLDSALESTAVNIENLTSSRSTLRDADIAKESSAFIKSQILQQAAATLMSTANQSPSIALQLI
jgi:flagellin-like hook-associated protein FlgL